MSIARDIATWISTTGRKGPVELATQAEVALGTDASRAVSPASLEGGIFPGGLIDTQVFTSSGTWTKPEGANKVHVSCVGGGGGGAGVSSTPVGFRVGGAGGGGAYSAGLFLASGWGSTVTVVVGAGGAGGSAGDNAGSPGSKSSFNGTISPYVSAGPGSAGNFSTLNSNGSGGAGGAPLSVGHIASTRERSNGGLGRGSILSGTVLQGASGGESNSPFSSGRVFDFSTTYPGSLAGNTPPTNSYGHGGGGALVQDTASAQAGGAGSKGVVIVQSYS